MAFNSAPMAEIELSLSCKNLRDRDVGSKSDPMVVLSQCEFGHSDKYNELMRTERIENNHNPEFATKLNLQYFFEQQQKLKFEVYDVDSSSSKLKEHDFLGRVELSLGEIVGAPGGVVHKALTGVKQGSILIRAEDTTNVLNEIVTFQLKCHKLENKDTFGKSDPFLNIYRIGADGSRILAYRSEMVKNNLNPVFKQFRVSSRQLCAGNHQQRIQFECFDYDSDGGQAHDLIGGCEVSLSQLIELPTVPLVNPKKAAKKKSYKNSGELQIVKCDVKVEPSFLDYIKGGVQMHCTVAVDFTASNGDPRDPRSLHYVHPYDPNQYQQALRAVGEICADYDSDKLFPALGFGARLPNGQVSHEFFLNMSPNNPQCFGVEGVLSAYRQALLQCQLYGPTNFAPVINHVAKFAAASARDGGHYFLLLIITDGIISDLEQTRAAIVNASYLPMSIIIVGVGQEDFSTMDFLDGDGKLLSVPGRTAARDMVQFVAFRDFQTTGNTQQGWAMTQARLAKEVLAELPSQLVQWMQMNNMQPRAPPVVNIQAMPAQAMPQQQGQGLDQNLSQLHIQHAPQSELIAFGQ